MLKYNSDFAKYASIDFKTPDGAKKMKEIIHSVMRARTKKRPEQQEVVIRYEMEGERAGMFGKPAYRKDKEHILVIVPSPEFARDKSFIAFYRKFSELFLRNEHGTNILKFALKNSLYENSYRAILCVHSIDDELPAFFCLKNRYFARDAKGRPVFLIGTGLLCACHEKDVESRFVQSRMELIAKNQEQ